MKKNVVGVISRGHPLNYVVEWCFFQCGALFFVWEAAFCGWGFSEECYIQMTYEGHARISEKTSAWIMLAIGLVGIALSCAYWALVVRRIRIRSRASRRQRMRRLGSDAADEAVQRERLVPRIEIPMGEGDDAAATGLRGRSPQGLSSPRAQLPLQRSPRPQRGLRSPGTSRDSAQGTRESEGPSMGELIEMASREPLQIVVQHEAGRGDDNEEWHQGVA